jgi:hypothetical protein
MKWQNAGPIGNTPTHSQTPDLRKRFYTTKTQSGQIWRLNRANIISLWLDDGHKQPDQGLTIEGFGKKSDSSAGFGARA